jgi:hypothetical protein
MGSLLEDIQATALDDTQSVAGLLRRVKLVAAKLGRDEPVAWVDHEMSGYPPDAPVPPYREITGSPTYWNPFHGWSQILFPENDTHRAASTVEIRDPIPQVEAHIAATKSGGTLRVEYPPELVAKLARGGRGIPERAGITLDTAKLVQVTAAVRDRVLDWAVQLEKAGVRGEGLSFSKQEQVAAASVVFNVTNFGTMATGHLGTAAGHAKVHSPVTISASHVEQLRSFADEVLRSLPASELPADRRAPLEETAGDLRRELDIPQPNASRIKRLLGAMRGFASDCGANLVASGIVHYLDTFKPPGW